MLKKIPFDIETAKKVVAGEIEGKLTLHGCYPVKIYDWNLYEDDEEEPVIVGKIIYKAEKEEVMTWDLKGESVEYGANYALELEVDRSKDQILKEDFKDLHYKIVQEIIDFCQDHEIEPYGMNMIISDLASSVDEGIWVPATDSTFELYNHTENSNQRNHETICFSA